MSKPNPWIKTLVLAAAAGVMVALVIVSRPSDKPFAGSSDDQGTALAPELTDPQKVSSLEVIGWDEQAVRPRAFKVEVQGNRWVVPSAFNYPVDATQNMAAAASSFIGALKDRIVTDQVTEHARLGVVAPDDVTSSVTTGRGTRVTMRDTTGKTVADLIIGGPAVDPASTPGAPAGKRYVREAGKNRVYATTLNQAYSTRLADWVQTDLLQVTADSVKKVAIDRYKVDEQKGTIVDLKTLALTRPDGARSADPDQPAPARVWTLTSSQGPVPPGGAVNQSRADDVLSALGSLKIVGVRPKPANLVNLMAGEASEGKISPLDQASLQQHGFFITSQGALVANEGSMTVGCADGVVYTLWIGELATDEATKDQAAGAASPGDQAGAGGRSADGRYMMVTVSFDQTLVGEAPQKSNELVELEKQAAALAEGQRLGDDANARLTNLSAAFKAQSDGFAARVKAGMDRQAQLAKRFAGWYYVVDATSLERLRPTREELLAQAPAAAPVAPPTVIPSQP
ncbi:MAG: DUF4340 domain-containing protein [Phycisphaerales bacterium]|nr:DUF4340 domain-containing protein [Phycisphaerales bacterium]